MYITARYEEGVLRGAIEKGVASTEYLYEVKVEGKSVEFLLRDGKDRELHFKEELPACEDALFDFIIPRLVKETGAVELSYHLWDDETPVVLRNFQKELNKDFDTYICLTALVSEEREAVVLSGIVETEDWVRSFYKIGLVPEKRAVEVVVDSIDGYGKVEHGTFHRIYLFEDLKRIAKYLATDRIFEYLFLKVLEASGVHDRMIEDIDYPKWFRDSKKEMERFKEVLLNSVFEKGEAMIVQNFEEGAKIIKGDLVVVKAYYEGYYVVKEKGKTVGSFKSAIDLGDFMNKHYGKLGEEIVGVLCMKVFDHLNKAEIEWLAKNNKTFREWLEELAEELGWQKWWLE